MQQYICAAGTLIVSCCKSGFLKNYSGILLDTICYSVRENMKRSQVSKCQREETEGDHTSSKGNQPWDLKWRFVMLIALWSLTSVSNTLLCIMTKTLTGKCGKKTSETKSPFILEDMLYSRTNIKSR